MGRFKAVILAGGSGERFWPLSTPERPKQFLDVFGGRSLIRQTFERLGNIVSPEDVFVITSSSLVGATRRELPELPRCNIVGEPMRRDTGAAVALGTGVAGDGVLAFFPADQLVTKPATFRKTVSRAVAMAMRNDTVVTIGIKPTYPATGFGYVNPESGSFVEKPNEGKARRYLKKGFLWNAGMFIARSDVFRNAFKSLASSLLPLTGLGPRQATPSRLRAMYATLPRISFDYAVMEKLNGVAVVDGDFGWDDVGGYGAFDRHFPHDDCGNVISGNCTAVDAFGNVCVAKSARTALFGVSNLIVITTPDAVLVADKSRIDEMKKLVATMARAASDADSDRMHA